MLGFSAEQIIGHNISSLFEHGAAEIHISADRQLIQSGIRVVYETNFSGPEIRYGLVRVLKSPLNDNQGNLHGIIGLISEINSGDGHQELSDSQNSDIDEFFKRMSSEPGDIEKHLLQGSRYVSNVDSGALKFENRFEIVLKALNAGVWEYDPGDEKINWSDKCFEIFGMEKGLEKPEQWKSKIHPEDVSGDNEM
jgi:PAS domain-containing protein